MPIRAVGPGWTTISPIALLSSAADFPAPPERPGYAPPLYPQEPEAGGECRRRMTMSSTTTRRAAAGARVC